MLRAGLQRVCRAHSIGTMGLNRRWARWAHAATAAPQIAPEGSPVMVHVQVAGKTANEDKLGKLLQAHPSLANIVSSELRANPEYVLYAARGFEDTAASTEMPIETFVVLRELFQTYPEMRSIEIGRDLTGERAVNAAAAQIPVLRSAPTLDETLKSSRQLRSALNGWDDEQQRRNFAEPLHEQHDLLGMLAPNVKLPPRMTYKDSLKAQVVLLGVIGVLFYAMALGTPEAPAVPKQYPFDGLKKEQGDYEHLRAVSE